MADMKRAQEEIAQEEYILEDEAQTSQASGAPDFKSDRDEIRHTSQQFFRSLFKAGVHLAMAPVYVLPDKPREHFFSAGREFTLGLSTLAQEIADDFDKLVTKGNE